ncbi:MAG: hypothetical protein PHX51_02430 [Clostridia bacterium]|nr:hypothetical protein [Clostridia bacterium]
MKLIEVLKAQEPLKRLMEKSFSNYGVLRNLVKLRKTVATETEFYAEQEKKNIELYAEKGDKGQPVFLSDGRLKLKDVDAKVAFETEIRKLNETEIDSIVCIKIKESDFRSTADLPTPSDMLALEAVIEFVE